MNLASPMDRVGKWTGASPQIERFEMADRETILVADDDATILHMLELMLEDAGYNVVKASGGEEALELVKVHRPDLVLIDFMMPNVDGCTVCERLRSEDDTRGLPVVVMSADRQVVKRAIEAKANAYLLKPFNMGEMLRCVQRWLDNSHRSSYLQYK